MNEGEKAMAETTLKQILESYREYQENGKNRDE